MVSDHCGSCTKQGPPEAVPMTATMGGSGKQLPFIDTVEAWGTVLGSTGIL